MVDLTHTSPMNCTLDDDDELPPVLFSKPPAVSTDTLYNIFTPAFSVQSVDAVVNLCDFDTDLAMNYLVSGPTAGVLLRLLRKSIVAGQRRSQFMTKKTYLRKLFSITSIQASTLAPLSESV